MSLFVGNISPHVQHRQLENAFRRFGRSNLELKDGYGFVVYEEYRDAERALRTLQGRLVCGERLSLSWARRRRPFQRFSGAGNTFRRASWDKDQDRISRRRPSLGLDKGPANDGKEHRASDAVQDGSRVSEAREDAAEKIAREEWKGQGEEKLEFEEEGKDTDPLDSGRWGEPLSEGSPEHMDDGPRDNGEDGLDEKEKEDNEGSLHEKSNGSPVDKSLERTSRAFHNADDQSRRGHDAFGKPQERCFNCGHLGHIMRQCRSRMNMNMYPRDSFDGRRNQFRNLRGVGFRGMGGRFRGIDGPRRVFNRDLEGSYGTRILRRRGSVGDRMHDQVDTRSRDKSRRRHHRSESRRDSPSRERSKKKRKKSSKKPSRSTRKRRRSSSGSPSASPSRSQSSSSSPSRSRSHSRSRSVASRSRSKSRSRSSSSVSRSHKSGSKSSRSRSISASSRSRSHSESSRSERSPSKSQSRSSKSRSRSASRSHSLPLSHSPDSPGLPSQPSIPFARDSTSSQGNSEERSRSSKFSRLQSKEFEVGSAATFATGSEIQEKQVSKTVDAEKEEKQVSRYSSEDEEMNEQYVKRKERKRHGFKESKKQKDLTRSEELHCEALEELQCEAQKLINGGNLNSENNQGSWGYQQQDYMSSPRLARGQGNLKSSEPEPSSFLAGDIHGSTYSAYMAVQARGAAHTGDSQHLAAPSFGAARLWPWDALLYQRLKRGPISVANYERRKLQNEEFGIEDKFVRSSSGWWENHAEY